MASGEIPALRTMLAARYELREEIGRGGCAVVFEALDHRLGRTVAVKVPLGFQGDMTKIARFERESRVISAIHHPNVCAVLDNGTTSRGAPFLVMERLFGDSLRTLLARRDRLPVADTISIALQLLSAIDAVHAVGIIHRDIKPDNIILVGRGGCDPIVKLLDFGLCRRSHQGANQEATMTADGAIVGTPEYMAPEQVLGTKPDVRIDTYAVGVVMYEMLTGDRTFFAKTVREILNGVMNKRIRPIRDLRRDVPRALEAIVHRAMSRDPKQRFQSAVEFQDALCTVKNELAAVARRAVERESRESSPPARETSPPRDTEWDMPTARLKAPPKPPPAPRNTRPPPAPEPATRVRRETGPMQPMPPAPRRDVRVDSAPTGRMVPPLPPRHHH